MSVQLRIPRTIVCIAYLRAPTGATYTIWIEPHGKDYRCCKESGRGGRVTHRRAWPEMKLEKAKKTFAKVVRDKTNPERPGRKYQIDRTSSKGLEALDLTTRKADVLRILKLKRKPRPRKSIDYGSRFAAKYEDSLDALLDAAQTMADLERYAGHSSCSAGDRSAIYDLKSHFSWFLFVVGRLKRVFVEAGGEMPEENMSEYCTLTFEIDGETYGWSLLKKDVPYPVRIESVYDMPSKIEMEPLKMTRVKFREAKAFVRWVMTGGKVGDEKQHSIEQ